MTYGNATVEVERKIQEHRDMIETSEKELNRLEELRKDEESKLSRMKGDLDAMVRTLTILKGETSNNQTVEQEFLPNIPITPTQSVLNLQPGSNTYIAREVLLAHGNPLSMPDLYAKARDKKPELKKTSFGANLYRVAKEGKIFKMKDQKVYLLEWGK